MRKSNFAQVGFLPCNCLKLRELVLKRHALAPSPLFSIYDFGMKGSFVSSLASPQPILTQWRAF